MLSPWSASFFLGAEELLFPKWLMLASDMMLITLFCCRFDNSAICFALSLLLPDAIVLNTGISRAKLRETSWEGSLDTFSITEEGCFIFNRSLSSGEARDATLLAALFPDELFKDA